MRRAALAAVVGAGVLAVMPARPVAARADDALAAMRAAMGGDAVLSAVQTLQIDGSEASWSTSGGGGASMSLQTRIALPDKFLRVAIQDFTAGPVGSMSLTNTHGFVGTGLIGRVVTSSGGELPAHPEFLGKSDAERAPLVKQAYDDERRRLVTWTLVLLGGANADPGFAVTGQHDATVGGKTAQIVDVTFWDGLSGQLTIDGATHLPARLSWTEPARAELKFTMTSESMVAVRGGQVVSATPASPPTAVGPVTSTPATGVTEFAVVVDQFKTDRGVTWPRRWTMTRDGKRSRETKVGRYTINPKFGKDAFSGR